MKALLRPKIKYNYIIIASIVILAIAAALYFYIQYQNIKQQLDNPADYSMTETKSIVERLGKLIELPTDETPTVATISDREKLIDQPFFVRAKNGDKVIIYTNAKKAILYDPQLNKIIEVAPINIGSPSASLQTQTSLRIALYNGTDTIGLTKLMEKDLIGKMANIEVLVKDNAKKRDYGKTVVIDLMGNKKDEAANVASLLKAEISALPQGEDPPKATNSAQIDLLVIIGADYVK